MGFFNVPAIAKESLRCKWGEERGVPLAVPVVTMWNVAATDCSLHEFSIPGGLRPPAQGCEERAVIACVGPPTYCCAHSCSRTQNRPRRGSLIISGSPTRLP